jgi:hypothetical protein
MTPEQATEIIGMLGAIKGFTAGTWIACTITMVVTIAKS